MKLDSVDLISAGSSYSMNLSFRDPGSTNPYQVRGIFGLDAEEIVTKYSGVGTGNGEKHYDLSLVSRTPVIRVALNPNFQNNQSFSDLRDNVYRMISSSRTGAITINFNNGEDTIAVLSGFISKVESTHFEKMPEIQITVAPDYPMLVSPEPYILYPENPSPGAILVSDELSTAPHGFQFAVTFTDSISSFIMQDQEATWSFGVQPNAPFEIDDVLVFSNEHNNNQLYVVRDAVNIHLADTVTPYSTIPKIFPGLNWFTIPEETTVLAVSYNYTYWGV